MEDLKNMMLAGLGSAAYTYEKASKLIDELIQKGKLTVEEGKELSQELKRSVVDKGERIKPITKEDMVQLLREMNFASKDDINEIKERLAKLEEKNQ